MRSLTTLFCRCDVPAVAIRSLAHKAVLSLIGYCCHSWDRRSVSLRRVIVNNKLRCEHHRTCVTSHPDLIPPIQNLHPLVLLSHCFISVHVTFHFNPKTLLWVFWACPSIPCRHPGLFSECVLKGCNTLFLSEASGIRAATTHCWNSEGCVTCWRSITGKKVASNQCWGGLNQQK